MPEHEPCDWCQDTQLVTLWHRQFTGSRTVMVEELDKRTGELVPRRVPGIVTIHCRECPLGELKYQQFSETDRRKLWTTRHLKAERPNYLIRNYLTTDPSYEPMFADWQSAIDWASTLGNPARTFPAIPRANRSTPERVANQLRDRTNEGDAA